MTSLVRRIGVPGAVTIGLAAMIGGGLFQVWSSAATSAGPWLLVALVIAAVIAALNALSSTQLAMAYPVSGGAYSYGRRLLGPGWGFAAGWLFLVGKTASAAGIALIAATYLVPGAAKPVAVAIIAVLAIVNALGVRSTVRVSAVIVAIVLLGLVVVIAGYWLGAFHPQPVLVPSSAASEFDWYGVLQAAGLLFFCFAGYARMSTLGEEVVNPRRTLPLAILGALAAVLVLYAVLALKLISGLGIDGLAASAAPLADLAGGGPAGIAVRALAGLACVGSLGGVLAGLSRTGLAMARGGDLPGALSRVHAIRRTPMTAEVTFAVLAAVGVVILDPAQLVGFSACAVLCYYAIAHLSAWRQPVGERWLPRLIQLVGLAGCVALAAALPALGLVLTAAALALGFVARALWRRGLSAVEG